MKSFLSEEGPPTELSKRWAEPAITVNGTDLTYAQSMVTRCAVTALLDQMRDPDYAKAVGPIAELYVARLREVLAIMSAVRP